MAAAQQPAQTEENVSDEPDSQPGLRIPRAGALTKEQRALSPVALELSGVGDRFKALSEKLDAATVDRGFAAAYLGICEEIDDLRSILSFFKKKLRERAQDEMRRMEAAELSGQARRGPPED